MANEGLDLRFRVKPLTAIAIAMIVFSFTFGLGGAFLPSASPFFKATSQNVSISPSSAPSPTPNPWREAAFSGMLKFTEQSRRYYLVTQDSEAITLQVIESVNLSKYVGKRILATGRYNTQTKILVVVEASDMEILPNQVIAIPSVAATPTPSIPPVTTIEPVF